jgi:hypothetical protein
MSATVNINSSALQIFLYISEVFRIQEVLNLYHGIYNFIKFVTFQHKMLTKLKKSIFFLALTTR